ncbi:hypothetical protein [Gorillibacterium sp. sgz5001074]|uniref:hypothetical protein n=1 Tax=Gorillibacterium sp. sgz5001074 TaxID=3446695 RepID=UPI003F66A40D
MLKKWIAVVLSLGLVMAASAVTLPEQASAAPYVMKTSYKSPKGTYKQPATNPNSGVSKTQPATGNKDSGTAGVTPAPKRSFFGGGFARGLFLGGMAGLLFGGMFGNMGFMGQFLGLMVNVLAIVILIMIVRRIFAYFTNRNRYNQNHRRS